MWKRDLGRLAAISVVTVVLGCKQLTGPSLDEVKSAFDFDAATLTARIDAFLAAMEPGRLEPLLALTASEIDTTAAPSHLPTPARADTAVTMDFSSVLGVTYVLPPDGIGYVPDLSRNSAPATGVALALYALDADAPDPGQEVGLLQISGLDSPVHLVTECGVFPAATVVAKYDPTPWRFTAEVGGELSVDLGLNTEHTPGDCSVTGGQSVELSGSFMQLAELSLTVDAQTNRQGVLNSSALTQFRLDVDSQLSFIGTNEVAVGESPPADVEFRGTRYGVFLDTIPLGPNLDAGFEVHMSVSIGSEGSPDLGIFVGRSLSLNQMEFIAFGEDEDSDPVPAVDVISQAAFDALVRVGGLGRQLAVVPDVSYGIVAWFDAQGIFDRCSRVADLEIAGITLLPCGDDPDLHFAKFREYGGHWYAVTRFQFTWLAARDYASRFGGYLVAIQDEAENDFVSTAYHTDFLGRICGPQGQFSCSWFQIGLFEPGGAPPWTLSTGAPASFFSWAPNPSSGHEEEYCALFGTSWGLWWTVRCDWPAWAIVEFETDPR